MTIRIIKGTTEYKKVPYFAGTSQDVIEGIDDAEGQRLVDLGYAEKIPDRPKPPLQIFADSPEKIRGKIAELEAKLAEARKEQTALLEDDLQDISGITRKIDGVNSRVSSLRMLIERQQAKLKKAEENEEREKEKDAVKTLEKATKEHKAEAEKIFTDILSAIAVIETKYEALDDLHKRVRDSFYADAPGMYLKTDCPLFRALHFPAMWKDGTDSIKACMTSNLAALERQAAQVPEELRGFYNSKRMKTASQLSDELRERENERRKQPDEIKLEARENGKWTSPEKDYTSVGRKQSPSEIYVGEVHDYSGAALN